MEGFRTILRLTLRIRVARHDAPLADANNIFLLMLCSFANQVLAQLVLLRYCSMRKQQNCTFQHSLLCRGTSLNGSCVLVGVSTNSPVKLSMPQPGGYHRWFEH